MSSILASAMVSMAELCSLVQYFEFRMAHYHMHMYMHTLVLVSTKVDRTSEMVFLIHVGVEQLMFAEWFNHRTRFTKPDQTRSPQCLNQVAAVQEELVWWCGYFVLAAAAGQCISKLPIPLQEISNFLQPKTICGEICDLAWTWKFYLLSACQTL